MTNDDNHQLRDWMESAHADEETPSFYETWARAVDRPARTARTVVRLGAALAAVLAGVVITTWVYEPAPVDYVGSSWIAPTDFLLETPGSEWMSTTPALYEPLPLNFDLNQEVTP